MNIIRIVPPGLLPFVFFLFFHFIAAPAGQAGVITLEAATSLRMGENEVEVDIRLRNRGDDEALNVAPVLRSGAWEDALPEKDKLPPGGEWRWSKSYGKNEMHLGKRGEYPLFVLIRYRDGNQYPFSMVDLPVMQNGQRPGDNPCTVEVSEEDKSLSYAVAVRNTQDQAVDAAVEFFAPEELPASALLELFQLPGGETRSLSFSLERGSALSGSVYSIFFATSCETQDYTWAVITPRRASIHPAPLKTGNNRAWIGVSIAFVAVLFALVLFLEIRGRRRDED